uniref:ARAD1D04686p n=1 Tax=Blastobotrys adeninivorans TaxID=409370 RepID=A0A060T7P3_BLAAD
MRAYGPRGFRFQRREVKSPTGVWFLKASRKFLVVVAAVYGGSAAGIGCLYLYTTWKLERVQPIPSDWSFKQKLLGLAGVNHHMDERHDMVVKYYEDLINQLVLDKNGNVIDLDTKTPAWLSGYADIAIRLGLSKDALGQTDDAIRALESGLSVPYGQKALKAQAATVLSRIKVAQDKLKEAEQLSEESAGYTGIQMGRSRSGGMLVQDDKSPSTGEEIEALTQLAKVYVKQKRLNDALNLLLGVQKRVKKLEEDSKCYEAVTMSYIAEVLWGLGQKKDAIVWGEGSYYNAFPNSRGTPECGLCAKIAAGNLSTMYKKVDEEQSSKFKHLSETQIIPLAVHKKSLFSSLL